MNSSRKFQNDLTANKPNGKDDVSSEVSGDPKSKKPNGKSVDSSAELLCSMIKKEEVVSTGDLPTLISDSNEQFSIFRKMIIPSEARWRAGRCRAKEYPGDDIPGAGAVTTKLSQGVTREAPETSIGMVEGTTTATAVLPPEPVPSGFTAERSPLLEDTLLLFFSPFSFLSHCEILI
ncbi:unnamed protein product [Brassica rapa]|uniref:Uncharacterized protein n=1 Tax=Brassica campestris TaxID=3711 RepID=A0A8D9GDT2_BRACM|nr:unnamed protein product [Brassica rapa]CAG7902522.1 unnamed protein product [Brassica rapa]CAG7908255.1 unnamed protein product [Brassica rapa]